MYSPICNGLIIVRGTNEIVLCVSGYPFLMTNVREYKIRNCALSERGWLSQQPQDFQERMAKAGTWMTLYKGQLVYDVGDPPDAIFGLDNGFLDISLPISPDEMVTLHRATPGFWIGDSSVLAETTRGVRVAAVSDCRIFRIPAGPIMRNLDRHPKDWICFYRLSHMNHLLAIQTLAEITSLPPRERIARLLLRQCTSQGLIQASQEELANMVGMSRTTFRRACLSLVVAGTIKASYRGVEILDHAGLERESTRPSGF